MAHGCFFSHHPFVVPARVSLIAEIYQGATHGVGHGCAIWAGALVVPAVTPLPRAAAELILAGTRDWPAATSAVMGSSLGGFYATWLAAQLHFRAVLINPAVFPARDLAKHIGEQTTWQAPEERFYFAPEFVTELTALEVGALENPQRVLAFIAKGDEVLDWREMCGRYPNSKQVVLEGGDHALSDFEQHVPHVLQFLQLTSG